MIYHVSDLKRFIRCPRSYFLSTCDEKIYSNFLRSDESTIELLAKHLHIEDSFLGFVGDDPERFFKEKDNYEWFIKTRLQEGSLRVKIPILHRINDKYDVYFVYRGTNIKELDKLYYRLNLEVLTNLGLEIDDVYIAYINGDYVFEDELDIDSLFIITDHYKGKRLINILEEEIDDYKEIINRIEATSLNSYEPKKIRACKGHSLCPHYYECFKEELNLPDDSILSLVSSKYKEQMYRNGIERLKDCDIELLEGNKVQYSQIMASRNGGLFVDRYSLKSFLEGLKIRPMSFVDFEWDTYLVPKYNGMKALDVLPFEFALYILNDNGELNHFCFVGNKDCRRDFIEELLNRLPKKGPILAYNAEGAECRRLKELAIQFPEYSEKINEVLSRFVDLAVPFIEGIVYDTRMEGNFTLKRLVNIVSNLDYKNLDISDGLSAVYNWRDIDRSDVEQSDTKVIEKLIEYCSLDAYGLYLVYNWLTKLV